MLLWLLLVLGSFLLIAAPAYLMVEARERRDKFKQMLAGEETVAHTVTFVDIFNPNQDGSKPFWARMPRLSRWLQPAGTTWKPGKVLAAAGAFAVAGALLGILERSRLGPYAPVLGAALFFLLPLFYVRLKGKRFLAAFEEQLPDGIEFLARALRSGYALSIGLEMLVEESNEPLRSQFLTVTREVALGAPMEVALRKMLERVPLLELRFFVASVLLQRETGGNLGETLDKLAAAVRARLQLRARVKAASAQGRLTARVLSLVPIILVLLMHLFAPGYMETLTNNSLGRTVMLCAVIGQITAYFWMKKIMDIEI
jgi:tight adherence protein B